MFAIVDAVNLWHDSHCPLEQWFSTGTRRYATCPLPPSVDWSPLTLNGDGRIMHCGSVCSVKKLNNFQLFRQWRIVIQSDRVCKFKHCDTTRALTTLESSPIRQPRLPTSFDWRCSGHEAVLWCSHRPVELLKQEVRVGRGENTQGRFMCTTNMFNKILQNPEKLSKLFLCCHVSIASES